MAKPGIVRSTTYLAKGWAHLWRHPKLWPWAAMPFVVNVVVYTIFALLGYWLWHKIMIDVVTQSPAWWGTAARWGVGIVVAVGLSILFIFTFTLVGSLIASPFNDVLARRTLLSLGRPVPEDAPLLRSIPRILGNQLKKFGVFVLVQIVVLLVWLIPGAGGFLYPLLASTVTVLFLAFDFLDFTWDQMRIPVAARYGYLFRHMGAATGFGASLFLASFVPLLGYFLIPVAVVSAALLYHDLETG